MLLLCTNPPERDPLPERGHVDSLGWEKDARIPPYSGLPNGCGSVEVLNSRDARVYVVDITPDNLHKSPGCYHFSTGEVVHCGSLDSAIAFLEQFGEYRGVFATRAIRDTSIEVGARSQIVCGWKTHVKCGARSTVVGVPTTVDAGECSTVLSTSPLAVLKAGDNSRVYGGGYQTEIIAGVGSVVSGSEETCLTVMYHDGWRQKKAVAYVGKTGSLKANIVYHVDNRGNFLEVERLPKFVPPPSPKRETDETAAHYVARCKEVRTDPFESARSLSDKATRLFEYLDASIYKDVGFKTSVVYRNPKGEHEFLKTLFPVRYHDRLFG